MTTPSLDKIARRAEADNAFWHPDKMPVARDVYFIGQQCHEDRAYLLSRLREAEVRVERMREVFDPVMESDWDKLFGFLPDSGHGQFWGKIFAKLHATLAQKEG